MDAKFTPGPWVANCFMVVAPPYVGIYGGTEICHTGCVGNRNTEQCEANARLIAASPDLYAELLKAHRDVCSLRCPSTKQTGEEWTHSPECMAIRAALAKAAK